MTSWPIHRVCWSGSGGGALPVFVCSGALQLGVDSLRRVYDRNMSPGTLGPVAEHEGQRVRGDAGNAGDKQDYHGVRQSELDRILPWSLASVWPPRRAWTATPSGRIGNLGGRGLRRTSASLLPCLFESTRREEPWTQGGDDGRELGSPKVGMPALCSCSSNGPQTPSNSLDVIALRSVQLRFPFAFLPRCIGPLGLSSAFQVCAGSSVSEQAD